MLCRFVVGNPRNLSSILERELCYSFCLVLVLFILGFVCLVVLMNNRILLLLLFCKIRGLVFVYFVVEDGTQMKWEMI